MILLLMGKIVDSQGNLFHAKIWSFFLKGNVNSSPNSHKSYIHPLKTNMDTKNWILGQGKQRIQKYVEKNYHQAQLQCIFSIPLHLLRYFGIDFPRQQIHEKTLDLRLHTQRPAEVLWQAFLLWYKPRWRKARCFILTLAEGSGDPRYNPPCVTGLARDLRGAVKLPKCNLESFKHLGI